MILLAALLQAAQTAPDIELGIQASIRRVRIERSGEARLEVTAGPDSVVRIEAPDANGRRTLRNVDLRIHAEARIADPLDPRVSVDAAASGDPAAADQNGGAAETPQPD